MTSRYSRAKNSPHYKLALLLLPQLNQIVLISRCQTRRLLLRSELRPPVYFLPILLLLVRFYSRSRHQSRRGLREIRSATVSAALGEKDTKNLGAVGGIKRDEATADRALATAPERVTLSLTAMDLLIGLLFGTLYDELLTTQTRGILKRWKSVTISIFEVVLYWRQTGSRLYAYAHGINILSPRNYRQNCLCSPPTKCTLAILSVMSGALC